MEGVREFITEFGAKAVLDVTTRLKFGSRWDYRNCLQRSIYAKNANLTWLLLQNGADPNDYTRFTYVLTIASGQGTSAQVEILLAYGAKADNDDSMALYVVAGKRPFGEEEQKILRLLLQNGADPNAVNTKGTAGTIWSSVGTSSNFGLYIFFPIYQFMNVCWI